VRAELRAAHTAGAKLLHIDHPDYPPSLAELDDAPPFLWLMGDAALLMRPMVALVGARNASSLGTRMARTLAQELGEAGYVVVSGLARGIDAAAHLAALPHGTVAVQAGGVDIMYPAENAKLAEDIAKSGLRLSEQPMGLQPTARFFPKRNRIISGLARATVVVEAASRSGSLITARDALDQGRDVLAVPGHPFDARAAGANMLIRDGATLVRNAADIIEALTPLKSPVEMHDPAPRSRPTAPARALNQKRSLLEMASLHLSILQRLGPSPVAEDQLIRDLQITPAAFSPALVELEMDGKVTRSAGGLLSRAN